MIPVSSLWYWPSDPTTKRTNTPQIIPSAATRIGSSGAPTSEQPLGEKHQSTQRAEGEGNQQPRKIEPELVVRPEHEAFDSSLIWGPIRHDESLTQKVCESQLWRSL